MLRHSIEKHTLEFKRPSGTSRGVLKTKDSWFIKLWDDAAPSVIGTGECSIIGGLSPDPLQDLEDRLEHLDWSLLVQSGGLDSLKYYPAIQFAVETALLDLKNGGKQVLFPSPFTAGVESININGLIWMGDESFMKSQIRDKIDQGFRCVKMKIGAIDFETEIALLESIRKEYSSDDIQLRVDANGAFDPVDALDKLKRLSELELHSIEQPIKQGMPEKMGRLCEFSPLPIALDEELIGLGTLQEKRLLLFTIGPQYIILKPSLLGGIQKSKEWIDLANEMNIGWWITSALESNIGLNAIAQWTATLDSQMFQGLGTGQLFANNVDSNLFLEGDRLWFKQS